MCCPKIFGGAIMFYNEYYELNKKISNLENEIETLKDRVEHLEEMYNTLLFDIQHFEMKHDQD